MRIHNIFSTAVHPDEAAALLAQIIPVVSPQTLPAVAFLPPPHVGTLISSQLESFNCSSARKSGMLVVRDHSFKHIQRETKSFFFWFSSFRTQTLPLISR